MAKGIDYSWDRPDLDCLKRQGVTFIVRYGSRDPSKNLSKSELNAILNRGMSVAVVWQEGKTQMTRGHSGGQTDARDANSFVNGLGLNGIPVYFSCDYDPPSSDWGKIDAYLDGVASIIGRPRTGGYGGLKFIQRGFGNGRLTYGWQTYAWSGVPTQWDSRAQLRQVNNDVVVCGGAIDWDESRAADFAQWPRSGGTAFPYDSKEETMQLAFDEGSESEAPACVIALGNQYSKGKHKLRFVAKDETTLRVDFGAGKTTITVECFAPNSVDIPDGKRSVIVKRDTGVSPVSVAISER